MPAVYRNFSQAELDAAYYNRAVEPRLASIKEDWDRRSKALYARARVTRDLAYGSGTRRNRTPSWPLARSRTTSTSH